MKTRPVPTNNESVNQDQLIVRKFLVFCFFGGPKGEIMRGFGKEARAAQLVRRLSL